MTLQTLWARDAGSESAIGQTAGFSLHAGVVAQADQRDKLPLRSRLRLATFATLRLERLCRYISRPAISEKRLSLTRTGLVRYELNTPYRDGTTHVFFEPLDFLARLAALVPKPRVNLTRFHGVFAPNSKLRAQVTQGGRGQGGRCSTPTDEKTPADRRAAMTWAQRLKRVFGIDIQTCTACGGAVRIVAAVEELGAIRAILDHLQERGAMPQAYYRPKARAPPDQAAGSSHRG